MRPKANIYQATERHTHLAVAHSSGNRFRGSSALLLRSQQASHDGSDLATLTFGTLLQLPLQQHIWADCTLDYTAVPG
jgi:hypothetical protein